MAALKIVAGALLGATLSAAAADAADMPGTWSPSEVRPRYVQLLSGWYLRADIGYRWNHVGSVETAVPTTSHRLGDSFGGTLGAGLRYKWFRTDVTIDRGSTSKFRADTALATTQPQYTSHIDSISLLANFYVDFGTWSGFTPYVGGGVGATYLRSAHYQNTQVALMPSPEAGQTNFSWAWMAGVAFQVQPNWLVDVGFRHLELGDVPNTAATQLPADGMTLRRLSTNEVRIGLRFLFD